MSSCSSRCSTSKRFSLVEPMLALRCSLFEAQQQPEAQARALVELMVLCRKAGKFAQGRSTLTVGKKIYAFFLNVFTAEAVQDNVVSCLWLSICVVIIWVVLKLQTFFISLHSLSSTATNLRSVGQSFSSESQAKYDAPDMYVEQLPQFMPFRVEISASMCTLCWNMRSADFTALS